MELKEQLKKRLDFIYKSDYKEEILTELVNAVEHTKKTYTSRGARWDEKDVVLITYGDSIIDGDNPSLDTLKSFVDSYLKEVVSFIHILPFSPYSSDDGFSVIDYYKINPSLGDWKHVKALSEDYRLMFDLVINHISQHSQWFQSYLKGESPESEYFIEADPSIDLSEVVRPRSLPLLTVVDTVKGKKHVWTTFSADQIDLNFQNPSLLLEMVKIFLYYLEQGAGMIRLDAIAFLWKEIGTNCLHLPETHEFVKLLRDISDEVSSDLIVLTETNVPNKENMSYFGDNDEANMVYQFSLPPLLLHALFSGNSTYLTKWARSIPELPVENTFFNFTASHDGVGVRPLEGLLPNEDIHALANGMGEFGGKINTRRNSDGTDSPYEINITYFDALKGTALGEDELHIQRFICSQVVMMSMQGMPAFYIHSLLGTHNYYEGVKETGMNRTINRRKWKKDELNALLESETHHSTVLRELSRLIKIRKAQKAFHPNESQKIVSLGSKIFGVSRGEGQLYSISNISLDEQSLSLQSIVGGNDKGFIDLISGQDILSDDPLKLAPYQTVWIRKKSLENA